MCEEREGGVWRGGVLRGQGQPARWMMICRGARADARCISPTKKVNQYNTVQFWTMTRSRFRRKKRRSDNQLVW